ncbi:MAG: HAD superfamily hydrolase (TIGR01490 family) [Motiliproteus sp.]|jgi:HAD superfamily hydrolase (TIGR01490 family)
MSHTAAFAFFDVDETLIVEKSMFCMLHEIEKHLGGINASDIRHRLQRMAREGEERAQVNLAYYRALAGLPRSEVQQLAADYVRRRLQADATEPYLIQPVVNQLQQLQADGITPVFLSGSAVDFLTPLADHLNVHHILATQLRVDTAGFYTGELACQPMIGTGKRQALINFADQHQSRLSECYAFGDHSSDAQYLSLVGRARIVSGDVQLEQLAQQQGWPIIQRPESSHTPASGCGATPRSTHA